MIMSHECEMGVRRPRSFRFASAAGYAAALALLACAACSSSSSPAKEPSDAGSEAGRLECQNDPRVVAYVPNLKKSSEGKTFEVTLVSADPAPPAVANSVPERSKWLVRISDPSGAPMPNATLKVEPYMPDHGHSPMDVVDAVDRGNGTYELSNIDFFMAGVWWVTISVQTAQDAGSAPADSARFVFCLPG